MTPNPGHPPRTTKPLMIHWSSGRIDGPHDRQVWSKMNWSLDSAMPIIGVEVVK